MYHLIFNTMTGSKFPKGTASFPTSLRKLEKGCVSRFLSRLTHAQLMRKNARCLNEIDSDEIRSFEKDRDSLLHYHLLQKQKR